jgi:hypothetical protein
MLVTGPVVTSARNPAAVSQGGRLCEKRTPFVTCSRLSGAVGMRCFFAAIGEMHKRPGHSEHWYPVALCSTEQLVKRCLRRASAKAD